VLFLIDDLLSWVLCGWSLTLFFLFIFFLIVLLIILFVGVCVLVILVFSVVILFNVSRIVLLVPNMDLSAHNVLQHLVIHLVEL
jgi:hypothetical protein